MNNSNGHVIDTRELTKTYKGVNALQGLKPKSTQEFHLRFSWPQRRR